MAACGTPTTRRTPPSGPRSADGPPHSSMGRPSRSSSGRPPATWSSTRTTAPAAAFASTIGGRTAPLLYGSAEQVFVRSATGDLVQYANDSAGGRPWNAYDLTTAAGGPQIAGDPSAVVVNEAAVYVFARMSSGDLVEFT